VCLEGYSGTLGVDDDCCGSGDEHVGCASGYTFSRQLAIAEGGTWDRPEGAGFYSTCGAAYGGNTCCTPVPQRVSLSGYSCANDYGSNPHDQSYGINGEYALVGHTADGKPYYKNILTHAHLFYDRNCGGGTDGASWRSGWFFGCSAPSLTASENLQGGHGGDCCNTAHISGDEFPMGTGTYWRWCGSQRASGNQDLTISVTPPSASSTSLPHHDHDMPGHGHQPSHHGQLREGIYVSFKTGESEDAVVDRALFKLVDASHIGFYRNGHQFPQTEPLEPSNLHLSQTFDFDGHTLSGCEGCEGTTGTLFPNGDIVWSNGYTSRYKEPLFPSPPEKHRTGEEGEEEEEGETARTVAPSASLAQKLSDSTSRLTLKQLVLVLIGAVLIVGAGIIGAILHRKRDATATQLVEITPMSSMTLDPAHVRSSTGGYDMRPIEGLPVQAQAIPVQAQAIPVQAQAMPVDVQTTPVEVQAKL